MKYLDMIRQHERTQPKDTVVDNVVETIHPQSWRELAKMTAGLERDDPRLGPVLSALAACEAHDKAGDRCGFEHAVERVTRLMQFAPGAHVHWRGSEGHRLKVLGPAPVEHVHCSEGQLWVWTAWKGQARWVPEHSITAIGDHGTR